MIQTLGYVGFVSPRHEEWLTFGPEILGLELAERGRDGAVRLRLDEAAQRISVHPGAADDLAYLGWTVANAAALRAAIAAVESAGLRVTRGEGELAAERRVADVAWFTDPFGFRHELALGLQAAKTPFEPSRPMAGRFVTGEGGLGHVVLIVPDLTKADRFYTELLGLRLSDTIVDRGMSLRFYHCNPRHHSLALASIPGLVGVHHLMLEATSLEDVATALELCRARGIPLAMDLGRHPNDEMTSFYVRSPSGFEVEYGFGGRLLESDATASPGHFEAMSLWGHKPPANPLVPGILRPAWPPR